MSRYQSPSGPIETERLADRIRRFAFEHYVSTARAHGLMEVEIRAGDVHRAMGLANRMPAVCAALGAPFAVLHGLRLIDRKGPAQGAGVVFRYQMIPNAEQPAVTPAAAVPQGTPEQVRHTMGANVPGTVFLVSCVGQKRASAAPARDLYISDWFLKARQYVERHDARWFILSAEYGLVPPDRVVAPYERTLNTMPIEVRRLWAKRVLEELAATVPDAKHVTFLAGQRYREFLEDALQRRGVTVEVPMEGLRIGEQLAWLGRS